MRKLDHYITVGDKQLRCGYTTGTCAAAAARAAAELLVCGREVPEVVVGTPAGIDVAIEVEESVLGRDWACCGVRKDAGDDPDVTDGALIRAKAMWSDMRGVRVVGGTGIGVVTRPGLDQAVGEWAINSAPRKMIIEQVSSVLEAVQPDRAGVLVELSVVDGERLAEKTFNPRLGIVGGISIIGTSGIVKPMSEEAVVQSVRLEIRQRRAEGAGRLVLVPGNYGLEFAKTSLGIPEVVPVQCSNYIGDALDYAVECGFREILVVGHIGKMAKVARGAFNTHSRMGDGRMEAIAEHARASGAGEGVCAKVMECVTTDAALDVLEAAGVLRPAMDSLVVRLADNLSARAGAGVRVQSVVFSKPRGLLGRAASSVQGGEA